MLKWWNKRLAVGRRLHISRASEVHVFVQHNPRLIWLLLLLVGPKECRPTYLLGLSLTRPLGWRAAIRRYSNESFPQAWLQALLWWPMPRQATLSYSHESFWIFPWSPRTSLPWETCQGQLTIKPLYHYTVAIQGGDLRGVSWSGLDI